MKANTLLGNSAASGNRKVSFKYARIARLVVAVVVMAVTQAQATTYTWTNKVTGAQDWSTAGNWSGGVYVSDSANELKFHPGVSATDRPAAGTQTITSIPAALSMNTLTLNGYSPDNALGHTLIFGDGSSVWMIGDGTTSTINLNALRHSFDARSMFYHLPNIVLNQSVTTITGNGTSAGFYFKGNIT